MTPRVCPHPDCDRFLAPTLFACHRHLAQLPRSLRDRIAAAWRAERVTEWLTYTDAALAYWEHLEVDA